MENNYYKINWIEAENFVFKLVRKYVGSKDLHIVAPYRGALPMGVMLSNKLNVPLTIIDFQRYDGDSKEAVYIKKTFNPNSQLLFIDDILDKGITFNEVMKLLLRGINKDKINVEFLVETPKEKQLNYNIKHYSHIKVQVDKWVIFPWE